MLFVESLKEEVKIIHRAIYYPETNANVFGVFYTFLKISFITLST